MSLCEGLIALNCPNLLGNFTFCNYIFGLWLLLYSPHTLLIKSVFMKLKKNQVEQRLNRRSEMKTISTAPLIQL